MVLPIVAYGHPILKRETVEVDLNENVVHDLLRDMWETMYHAEGVGLAAPQVGKSWRIFVVDTCQVYEEEEKAKGIRQAFINPEIIEETGEEWTYEEGCLSIPKIRGDVTRLPKIKIRYQDEDGVVNESEFDGINARVIQHEHDHLEGILFTELLKPVKKRMIRRKLQAIRKGKVETDYEMLFYK